MKKDRTSEGARTALVASPVLLALTQRAWAGRAGARQNSYVDPPGTRAGEDDNVSNRGRLRVKPSDGEGATSTR